MIYAALIVVGCDRQGCYERENIESASRTFVSVSSFENQIKQHWIVIGGKHYCSKACADAAKAAKTEANTK